MNWAAQAHADNATDPIRHSGHRARSHARPPGRPRRNTRLSPHEISLGLGPSEVRTQGWIITPCFGFPPGSRRDDWELIWLLVARCDALDLFHPFPRARGRRPCGMPAGRPDFFTSGFCEKVWRRPGGKGGLRGLGKGVALPGYSMGYRAVVRTTTTTPRRKKELRRFQIWRSTYSEDDLRSAGDVSTVRLR